jgi:hypothetical protein
VLKDAQLASEIIAALKKKKLGQAALVIPQLGYGTTKARVNGLLRNRSGGRLTK